MRPTPTQIATLRAQLRSSSDGAASALQTADERNAALQAAISNLEAQLAAQRDELLGKLHAQHEALAAQHAQREDLLSDLHAQRAQREELEAQLAAQRAQHEGQVSSAFSYTVWYC